MNDAELFDGWCAGDQRAGAALFDRHFAAIARFFRNKVADEFEDLVQQTFTSCLESRDRFRRESSFRTFLFAIANNILRHHYRTRGRDRLELREVSVHDLQPGPSTFVARAREHQLLAESLRRIPLELQVILELFYWEGLSARVIGEILGESEHTIHNRLRRGKQLLRARMEALTADADELEHTWSGIDRWAEEVAAGLGKSGGS